MNSEQYAQFLLQRIPTAKKASGGRVINCRCFYCPDSQDPRSKHFYISIPQSNDEPSYYYCHKCHASGVVTYKKLIEWDIYDEQIALDLEKHNKNCSRYSSNKKYFDQSIYRLQNQYISDTKISQIKLQMLNRRLGCQFTFNELKELKIVLNLNDLLQSNYIRNLTRDPNIVSQLDANFIGFISIDNAFLNMRRMCEEGKVYKSIDKRYINYKIFDKFDSSERFYTIPAKLDLTCPQRIKIHVAEGPFDILSIYKNLRNKEPGIYTSIAGSNYLGIAIYFLTKFRLPYVEFHYYPDNDQYGSNQAMMKVANFLRPTGFPFYIHRNLYPGAKDFGVFPDHIQESIQRIL